MYINVMGKNMVRDNIGMGSCNDKGCNEWWCFHCSICKWPSLHLVLPILLSNFRSGGFVIRPHWVLAFAMRQDIFILVVSHIVTVTSISPFPPQ